MENSSETQIIEKSSPLEIVSSAITAQMAKSVMYSSYHYEPATSEYVRKCATNFQMVIDAGFTAEAFECMREGWIDEDGKEHFLLIQDTINRFKWSEWQERVHTDEKKLQDNYAINRIVSWGLQDIFTDEVFDNLLAAQGVNTKRVAEFKKSTQQMSVEVRGAFLEAGLNVNNPSTLRAIIWNLLDKGYYSHVIQIVTMLVKQPYFEVLSARAQVKDPEIVSFLSESAASAIKELLEPGRYTHVYLRSTEPSIDFDAGAPWDPEDFS